MIIAPSPRRVASCELDHANQAEPGCSTSIRMFASTRVDIVERSASHLHDFVGGEPRIGGSLEPFEPFFKFTNPAPSLGLGISGYLFDDDLPSIVEYIEVGRGRDSGAVANGLGNGDLALAGDAHGNTSKVLPSR